MDGDAGQSGPILRLQVNCKQFILGSSKLGGCPLTSHKAGRRAGGLHAPDWQPEEVRQGGGAIRGSSQELLTDQVLLLTVGVRACAHNILQVFPEDVNKYESSSMWVLYVIRIDLEGRQIGQNSHLKREF